VTPGIITLPKKGITMRHSVLFATAFATLISTQTFAADLPGKGITVNPVQSTITEETFQTLLVSRALEKLGYTVNKPSEVDYNVGYTSLASGDATFTAVNWTPCMTTCTKLPVAIRNFIVKGYLLTARHRVT